MIAQALARYGIEALFKGSNRQDQRDQGLSNEEIEAIIDGYWFISDDLKRRLKGVYSQMGRRRRTDWSTCTALMALVAESGEISHDADSNPWWLVAFVGAGRFIPSGNGFLAPDGRLFNSERALAPM